MIRALREFWNGWRLHRRTKTGKQTWGRQPEPATPGVVAVKAPAVGRIEHMVVTRADGTKELYDGTGSRVK